MCHGVVAGLASCLPACAAWRAGRKSIFHCIVGRGSWGWTSLFTPPHFCVYRRESGGGGLIFCNTAHAHGHALHVGIWTFPSSSLLSSSFFFLLLPAILFLYFLSLPTTSTPVSSHYVSLPATCLSSCSFSVSYSLALHLYFCIDKNIFETETRTGTWEGLSFFLFLMLGWACICLACNHTCMSACSHVSSACCCCCCMCLYHAVPVYSAVYHADVAVLDL